MAVGAPYQQPLFGHIDKDTFKQIFRDHWKAFQQKNSRYDTVYYQTVIEKMIHCGQPEKMGFAQFFCPDCGETKKVAFSCKSCFCLSCAQKYADRWVEFISRRLFPGVVYRHITLTVPQYLRTWFYRNQQLLNPLMKAGHDCLIDVINFIAKKDIDIGSVVVLQLTGRPSRYNPHLHAIVTSGGIDQLTKKWRHIKSIPFTLIHRKWQYHLLTMMRKVIDDPIIEKHIDWGWNHYPKGFVAHVQRGQVPKKSKGIARYLAKYLVSPPISLKRIEEYDGETVAYWYRDHNTNKIQYEVVDAMTFIGRMVQNILPKGFQRIRYFGLQSNRRYQPVREQLKQILHPHIPDDPLGYRVIPPKTFPQLCLMTFGVSPLDCPKCGQNMELQFIKHPRYGVFKDFFQEGWIPGGLDEQKRQQTGGDGPHYGRVSGLQRWPRSVVQIPLPFM